MTGPELVVLVILFALVAWYGARRGLGPVDGEKAGLIFLTLTSVLFFGLYEWDEHRDGSERAHAIELSGRMATMVQGCEDDSRALVRTVAGFGSRPDSIAAALRRMLDRPKDETPTGR